jgi:very-short-patch-repair endonuclease/DNA-directed RNA polymerase subunit RPC12/RpoP
MMDDMWEEFSSMGDDGYVNERSLLHWCRTHGERGKLLIREWDAEKNINEFGMPVLMQEVYAATTGKKYWWTCSECGEDFLMCADCRTRQNQGCPRCGNKNKGSTNRKNAAQNGNDLLSFCRNNGVFGSTLTKEWDEQKNLEVHGLSMRDVAKKSSLEAFWICGRCGYRYQKSVYKRVALGLGCPACNRIGTSFPEQVICRSLRQVFPDTVSRAKLFGNIEFDIYVPSKKLAIEYGGSYWHKGKEEKDQRKADLCEQHGVQFISVAANNGAEEMEFDGNKISYNISTTKHNQQLYQIVDYILGKMDHTIDDVDFEKAVNDSYGQMLGEIEDNFTKYEPELVAEWDRELNKGIEPEFFTAGSDQRVKWKCAKCGNIFENSIHSRIRFRSGCKKCGYNVFDNKIHKRTNKQNNIIWFGVNNL